MKFSRYDLPMPNRSYSSKNNLNWLVGKLSVINPETSKWCS